MNLYNQIKYNGYRINIYYDDDARSPREAYDNLGTLYTAHRRYRPEKEFDDHFDIDKVFEGHIGNFRELFLDRKSTRLNSSHNNQSRMPSSA